MKNIQFAIFYLIVILVYSAVNYYIFRHGYRALSGTSFRQAYTWVFIGLSSAYIIGRLLHAFIPNGLSQIFLQVGSFWLGPMFYFLLMVLVIDLARLILLIHPEWNSYFAQPQIRAVVFWSSVSLVSVIIMVGVINFSRIKTKVIDLEFNKPKSGIKNLTIAVASDIHLGQTIGKRRLEKIVSIMNRNNPDLVLFAGDFVDEDVDIVIKKDMGSPLAKLINREKVYAITGNHEYIGNAEKAVNYFTRKGVRFIRDTVTLLDKKIYLIGREDRDMSRFKGRKRKEIPQLVEGIEFSKLVIWLDHQPPRFEEVAQMAVDLCISGHTHHGQLWPLNYLTQSIYKLSWGLKRVSNTWFYVSSGAGGWGPNMRIGSRPEVVIFRLTNVANFED